MRDSAPNAKSRYVISSPKVIVNWDDQQRFSAAPSLVDKQKNRYTYFFRTIHLEIKTSGPVQESGTRGLERRTLTVASDIEWRAYAVPLYLGGHVLTVLFIVGMVTWCSVNQRPCAPLLAFLISTLLEKTLSNCDLPSELDTVDTGQPFKFALMMQLRHVPINFCGVCWQLHLPNWPSIAAYHVLKLVNIARHAAVLKLQYGMTNEWQLRSV